MLLSGVPSRVPVNVPSFTDQLGGVGEVVALASEVSTGLACL
jgi:hypothetical protein